MDSTWYTVRADGRALAHHLGDARWMLGLRSSMPRVLAVPVWWQRYAEWHVAHGPAAPSDVIREAFEMHVEAVERAIADELSPALQSLAVAVRLAADGFEGLRR